MKTRAPLALSLLLLLPALPTAVRADPYGDPYHGDTGYHDFSDHAFLARLDLAGNANLNTALWGSYTSTIKAYFDAGDDTDAKGEFFAYLQARQSLGSAPVLHGITSTPILDPNLTTDLGHTYNFYGVPSDVNVDGVDTPSSDNPNYPYGDVDWSLREPPDFPSDWTTQLVRFDYLSRVTFDTTPGDDGAVKLANLDNMMTMALDYIHDKGCSTATGEGAGYGGGLQSAFRLLNWTTSYFTMIQVPATITVDGEPVVGATPDRMIGILKHMLEMADYAADPTSFLGIDNNRGLTQAEAVYYFATYFPEFSDAASWQATAQGWKDTYMPANIYRDGALGEPALLYHQEQIEQLYDFQKQAVANGASSLFTDDQKKIYDRMLTYWEDTLTPGVVPPTGTPPEGQLFLVGDTSFPVHGPELATIANDVNRYSGEVANLPREDIIYAATEGAYGAVPGHTSALYGHGVAVMRTGWDYDSVVAFIENEPSGNHSHPDDLAFSLYGYGQQCILNSGRDSYDTSNSVAVWHSSETEANSTVQIDSRPNKTYGEHINQWIHQGGFDFYEGQETDALAGATLPTDDAYIDEATPDVTHDTEIMSVKVTAAHDADQMTYVKFRTGTVLGSLDSATLKITGKALSHPAQLDVYGIEEPTPSDPNDWSGIIASDWNESNLMWSSAPYHPDTIAAGASAVKLGSLTFNTAATTTQTLASSALLDFVAGQSDSSHRGAVTLAFTQDSPDGTVFHLDSLKSTARPELSLTVDGGNPVTDAITHRRNVYFDRSGLFIVSDLLSGATQSHQYEQLWGLKSTTPPAIDSDGKETIQYFNGNTSSPTAWLQIATADASSLSAAVLKTGWYSYSTTSGPTENKRVDYVRTGSGDVTFDTAIRCTPGSASSPPDLQVERLSLGVDPDVATGLKVHLDSGADDDEVVTYFLSHAAPTLRTFDTYQTDGIMAAVKKSNASALETLDLNGGTTVIDGTNTLVSSSAPLNDLSVDYRTSGQLILSSSKALSATISLYSPSTITAISFNGESLPFTVSGDVYAVARKLLAAYDFENGGTTAWTLLNDAAFAVNDVSGNKVFEQSTHTVDASAVIGSSDWTDYAVESTVQIAALDDDSDRVGLLGRYTESGGHYYGFVYDRQSGLSGGLQGKLRIIKNVGGTITLLAAKDYMLHLGTPYKFKAVFDGLNLSFYVNDVLELTATAQSLTTGKAGILADRADVFFDDFSVAGKTSLTPNPAETGRLVTLLPSGNSYVGDCAPDANIFDHFVGDSNARLGTQTSATVGNTRTAYVKFRLSDYGPNTIAHAILRLNGYEEGYTPTSTAATVKIYGIAATDWNDRQMTYANQPGSGSATLLDTRSVNQPSTQDVDVTSYLNSHSTDPEVCFLIQCDDDVRVDFFSDVYVEKPELIINN